MADKIKVTILRDGSLKIETDGISAANHTNAEGLITELITKAGGDVDRIDKGGHFHTEEGIYHSH